MGSFAAAVSWLLDKHSVLGKGKGFSGYPSMCAFDCPIGSLPNRHQAAEQEEAESFSSLLVPCFRVVLGAVLVPVSELLGCVHGCEQEARVT